MSMLPDKKEKQADIETIRNIYMIIANHALGDDATSVWTRVQLIEWLEQQTNCSFRNTEDFNNKMTRFLSHDETDGMRLRKIRKQMGLSQRVLSLKLGVSQQFLAQMESDRRPLILNALRFIDMQGVSTYAQPEFACQNAIDSKQDTDTEIGGQ